MTLFPVSLFQGQWTCVEVNNHQKHFLGVFSIVTFQGVLLGLNLEK